MAIKDDACLSKRMPFWISHYGDYACQVRWKRRQYLNGTALQGHQNAVHGGKFDPNCPACKEIKAKSYALELARV